MYDISITMAAIRTHNWKELYDTAMTSCSRHKLEVVIVSPFDLPQSLTKYDNIRLIKDWGNPNRCIQIANIEAKGDLIFNCVDDGTFFNDAIDWSVDYFRDHCKENDVINLRYKEHATKQGHTFPLESWYAWAHEELRLPYVDRKWAIALHFIMKKATFIKYGGLDMRYEYCVHPTLDLIFRIQQDGGIVHHSDIEGMNASHLPGYAGDHGPIHDSQTFHDLPIFTETYTTIPVKDRLYMDIDAWKNVPPVWTRRFGNTFPATYEELCKEKGYIIPKI
jgi:hypothetical protein